jgi:AcrR family transcriptional regulator
VRDSGLERASIGELRTRIGLDRSAIYYYYPTKEALIDAAAQAVGKMYVGKLELIRPFEEAEKIARKKSLKRRLAAPAGIRC